MFSHLSSLLSCSPIYFLYCSSDGLFTLVSLIPLVSHILFGLDGKIYCYELIAIPWGIILTFFVPEQMAQPY